MNLAHDLATLPTLSVAQLRSRYAEVFGEAPLTINKTWLVRRLAWRLQAIALGDLSERARQRAAQLANDADLRLSSPRRQANAAPIPSIAAETFLPVTSIGPVAAPPDARLPPPGTMITRLYKGQQLEVTVLSSGFAFQGKAFLSLSALAKAITGSHCNGFLFFRLNKAQTTAKTETNP